MFEHILLPLDGSAFAECSLSHAVTIAQIFHSQVSQLRVLDPVCSSVHYSARDPLDWYLEKTRAEKYLSGTATRLREASIVVQEVLLEGNSAEQVIAFAHRNQVDLIILCRCGESGRNVWPLGSVAQKVVLGARTSVMMVQADRPLPLESSGVQYRRILLPFDCSQRAESALSAARLIGNACSSELLLAHGLQRPLMFCKGPADEEGVELADKLIERNRAEAESYLNAVRCWLEPYTNAQVHLFESENVKASLHALVERHAADLVILSAHGYSGDAQRVYGSIAESFITYGKATVLVYQDIPVDRFEPMMAEVAAREVGIKPLHRA